KQHRMDKCSPAGDCVGAITPMVCRGSHMIQHIHTHTHTHTHTRTHIHAYTRSHTHTERHINPLTVCSKSAPCNMQQKNLLTSKNLPLTAPVSHTHTHTHTHTHIWTLEAKKRNR